MEHDAPALRDAVRLELDVPSTAPVGLPVSITLRVENLRDHPIELTLRGRTIAFDVIVRRADGTVAWQRLGGGMIPAILRLEPLAARAVLELRTLWDPSLTDARPVAGEFMVEAVLFTDGPDLRPPPARLRVIPGEAANDGTA